MRQRRHISATATAGSGAGADPYAYDNQADAYGIVVLQLRRRPLRREQRRRQRHGQLGRLLRLRERHRHRGAVIGVDGYGSIDINNDGGSVIANGEDNAIGIPAQTYGGNYGGYVDVDNDRQRRGERGRRLLHRERDRHRIDATYAVFHNDGGSIYASRRRRLLLRRRTRRPASTSTRSPSASSSTARKKEAYVFESGFHNAGTIYAYASGYDGCSIGAYMLSYYGLTRLQRRRDHRDRARRLRRGGRLFAGSDIGGVDCSTTATSTPAPSYLATGVWLGTDTTATSTTPAPSKPPARTTTRHRYLVRRLGRLHLQLRHDHRRDLDRRRRRLPVQRDGAWNAGQTSSYFGDGDDGIVNYGTDQHGRLGHRPGLPRVDGNYFYNYGMITVEGDTTSSTWATARWHAGALAQPDRLLQRTA